MHPDAYVELRDRAKDIIISGGENTSTVEVEHAIESHPAVLEAAVVGGPDEKWGQRPKAFVVRRPRTDVSEADLVAHGRLQIARFKAPEAVEFVDALPRTSSGKVQTFETAREGMGRPHRPYPGLNRQEGRCSRMTATPRRPCTGRGPDGRWVPTTSACAFCGRSLRRRPA
jgi:acyl-CoA synthetase (AMP-forming)/AMP-acid ligase II